MFGDFFKSNKKEKVDKDTKQFYRSRMIIPCTNVVDNIVFSKKSVWAYYILSKKQWGTLSTDDKLLLIRDMKSAFVQLSAHKQSEVDCHMFSMGFPFDVEDWYEQILGVYNKYSGEELEDSDYAYDYLLQTKLDLYSKSSNDKYVFLGVKLGTRGTINASFESFVDNDTNVREYMRELQKTLVNKLNFDETDISEDELRAFKASEKGIRNLLTSSALLPKDDRGIPSSEMLLLVIKRLTHPAILHTLLETDYSNRIGFSDIMAETTGEIEVQPKFMKFTNVIEKQDDEGYPILEEVETYRTDIAFGQFPDFASALQPLFYNADVDVNMRFTLIPVEKMKKNLQHKKLESKDEQQNMAEGEADYNEEIMTKMSQIDILDSALTQDGQTPWVKGSYYIVIDGIDKDYMKRQIIQIKKMLTEMGYKMVWTTGDHKDLWLENFPGGEMEIKSFIQYTNLNHVMLFGANLGDEVGDEIKQTLKKNNREV